MTEDTRELTTELTAEEAALLLQIVQKSNLAVPMNDPDQAIKTALMVKAILRKIGIMARAGEGAPQNGEGMQQKSAESSDSAR